MFKKKYLLLAAIAVFTICFSLNSFGSEKAIPSTTEKDGCGYYDDYGHACGYCDDDDPIVRCGDGTWACTAMECDC